jgi:hypothetical protein
MSDTTFPNNGGWKFRQAQTNWTNPMAMVGLKASVDAIRKHRQANPAITAKFKLSTDPAAIEQELIAYQQARGALPQTAPTFFAQSSSRLPQRVVAAAVHIRRAAQGTAVVLDWLTSGGKPVAQELAEARAKICVACPKNVPGEWYTTAPAELIRATLSARSDLKLETPYDDKLQSCDVCRCLLRLKAFCPLDHILKGTKSEIMAEFPETCWIKCESALSTSASPKAR